MNNDEKPTIYRCGYCGYPTDHQGQPLEMNDDEIDEYLKKHSESYTAPVNGFCCPNGEQS